MVKMRGWRLIIMMAVVESGHDPSQKTVVFFIYVLYKSELGMGGSYVEGLTVINKLPSGGVHRAGEDLSLNKRSGETPSVSWI